MREKSAGVSEGGLILHIRDSVDFSIISDADKSI